MFRNNSFEYLQLCGNDIIYILLGLISGCIASYMSVYVNEHIGKIMIGDFSNERLYLLFKSSFVTIITTSLRGSLFTYSGKSMNHRMRCIVFKKILNQSSRYYEEKTVNDLIECATNDVHIVSNIISLHINVLSRSLVNVAIVYVLLSRISVKLTLITTIIIILDFCISHTYNKIHEKSMKGVDDANKNLNSYVRESLSHVSMIKTYATEEITILKFNKYSLNIAKYFFKECQLYALHLFIICNLPTVSTIIIIISARYLNKKEGIIAFILHNQGMYGTIKQITDLKDQYTRCKEPFERIVKIMKSESITEGYYIPNEDIKGEIKFENIHFKYASAETQVLNGLNLKINNGDKIAIIGESGCGKSTIAKLLVGILSPYRGNIYIDNINIKHYDNKWLKTKIGYMAQDSVLFSDTIANNISYGIEKCSREEIQEAAKMANADEFINNLKDKYDTVLECTELGSLSGGQRQRITIARIFIRKPKIIILDEATSALDSNCEDIVQNTINKCFGENNSSMIIIAHRKSALAIANKIYTLKDSKIILN